MSDTVKILVTDDSIVLRRVLGMTLGEDAELEVVHAASNGREAVDAVASQKFDVVIMDVEMPVMDGIEATAEIRKLDADLPIVMFSSVTSAGADATFRALTAGANDYIPKPSRVGHVTNAIQQIRNELLPKIKGWGRRYQRLRTETPKAAPAVRPSQQPFRPKRPADVIAIGVSTGGPDALAKLMPTLPGDLRSPVLIVQHMPPVFTELLAKRLDAICPLSVKEAAAGDLIHPGGVWIAPGGQHMVVQNCGAHLTVELDDGPPVQSCKPAVDVLFNSVAECYGDRALAVVLTGMGCDGCDGAHRIRKAGGQVIVQDEHTCVVWGMPAAVANAGLADGQYPLDQIGAEITQRTRTPNAARTLQTQTN